jgi:hypothetical protein
VRGDERRSHPAAARHEVPPTFDVYKTLMS